jgi:hypothetical protein
MLSYEDATQGTEYAVGIALFPNVADRPGCLR